VHGEHVWFVCTWDTCSHQYKPIVSCTHLTLRSLVTDCLSSISLSSVCSLSLSLRQSISISLFSSISSLSFYFSSSSCLFLSQVDEQKLDPFCRVCMRVADDHRRRCVSTIEQCFLSLSVSQTLSITPPRLSSPRLPSPPPSRPSYPCPLLLIPSSPPPPRPPPSLVPPPPSPQGWTRPGAAVQPHRRAAPRRRIRRRARAACARAWHI